MYLIGHNIEIMRKLEMARLDMLSSHDITTRDADLNELCSDRDNPDIDLENKILKRTETSFSSKKNRDLLARNC